MQWDSYQPREYGGRRYGMKSESFADYVSLPANLDARFELALGSADAPRKRLAEAGWRIIDPLVITRDPWTYQDYLQGSKAEFSVAKHGYVVTRSGWFSERSAAYLACGRPVLLQDTGISTWLRVGQGALTFRTPAEATAGIEEINARYEFHCSASRDVAAEYFDARQVLAKLVGQSMTWGSV